MGDAARPPDKPARTLAGHVDDRRALAFLLGGLAATKLLLLLWLGPVALEDTGGYVAFADAILGDRRWLSDAGLHDAAMPLTAFRVIGFPAIIAGVKLLAGSAWAEAIVIAQILLSLLATAAVFCLARAFGLTIVPAALATLAGASSVQLVLDQCLLTDSLYGSLMILALAPLSRGALESRLLAPRHALVSGLLIACGFLLREATSFLVVSLLPLAAWCVSQSPGSKRAAGFAAVMLFLPLLATNLAYQLWNAQRSGEHFVTTSAQTAVLQLLMVAAANDPAVFAGDSPIDRAAREVVRRHDFAEVRDLNEVLFARYHMTGPAIAGAAYRKYFEAWLRQPLAVAAAVVSGLGAQELHLAFRPLTSLEELYRWRHDRLLWDKRDWRKLTAVRTSQLPILLVDGLQKALASVLFACFLIGVPWQAVRAFRREATLPWREGTALALWLLYLGFFGTYALVHIEPRYMTPVVPFLALLGTLVLTHSVQKWRARIS